MHPGFGVKLDRLQCSQWGGGCTLGGSCTQGWEVAPMGAAAPQEQAHPQPTPQLPTAPPILTPVLPRPVGAATPWGRAAGIRGAAGARQPQTLLSRRPRVSRSQGAGGVP